MERRPWVGVIAYSREVEGLGEELPVEGCVPDGLIEAVSVAGAARFAVAVQWHREWRPHEHPLYDALFRGFAEVCHDHAAG